MQAAVPAAQRTWQVTLSRKNIGGGGDAADGAAPLVGRRLAASPCWLNPAICAPAGIGPPKRTAAATAVAAAATAAATAAAASSLAFAAFAASEFA